MTTTIPFPSMGIDAYLSDEEYTILRVGRNLAGHPDYQPGTRVRLISDSVDNPPGHHPNSAYVTVCRANATQAAFVGIKKADLQLCQPIAEQDVTTRAIEYLACMLYLQDIHTPKPPKFWGLVATEQKELYLRRARSSVEKWLGREASLLAAWNALREDLGLEPLSETGEG